MSVKLKSITDKSWLVINDIDSDRVGLLTEIRNQYVLMVAGAKKQFLDRKEVNTYFNEDVFGTILEKEDDTIKKDFFINGYPVDFDSPNEVIIKGNKLPLFSKKATSEVYYSAGYFCLYFPKNIMPAFCPKLSTLNSYEYKGPFKDEITMKAELLRLRKLRNNLV